jgi:hypothetical protein
VSAKPVPRRLPTSEDLARAVVLYHERDRWTEAKQAEWNRLTGEPPDQTIARSEVLVEMAKALLEASVRIDLGPAAQEIR